MHSIRRRLTVHLLVVIAALTLLGNLVLYYRVKGALGRQYDDGLLSRAGALSHLIAWDVGGTMMLEIPEKSLDEFNRQNAPDYLEVWRPDGSVFLRTPGLAGSDIWPSPLPTDQTFWSLTLPDGRPGRATVLRFPPHLEADEPQTPLRKARPPPPGETILVLASGTQRVHDFLSDLILTQIAGTLLLAALTALAVILAIKRGLKPLERLALEAADFPAAALDHRFSETDLPAELRPITRRLNDLLARIQEAFSRERRFTSNVAHELRTPIAELRTMAEVALACPRNASQPTVELEETLAIARQMQALVESLLSLARAESFPAAVHMQDENLESIIRASLRPFEGAARESNIQIDCQIAPGEITTDRAILEPLLRNLFSNAVQYSPPNSAISVHAQIRDRQPYIAITNAAPNLEPADLPRFAEPFWRKDSARTDSTHAGLGFPLALAYALMLSLEIQPSLCNHLLTVQVSATESRTTPHLRERTLPTVPSEVSINKP